MKKVARVAVDSPVTSVLAEVHGTGATGRSAMSMPTSGVGLTVTGVLLSRKCVTGCSLMRSKTFGAVRVALGCNTSGGRGIVSKLGEVSGPKLHICTGARSVPGMLNKLKATVVSAGGNMMASGRTEGLNMNKRILYFI